MATAIIGGLQRFMLTGVVNGQAIGLNSTVPAQNTTAHAYNIKMVSNVTATVDSPEQIAFNGADAEQERLFFGTNRTSALEITLDEVDETLISFLGGTTVDSTTNSAMPIWTAEANESDLPSVAIVLAQRGRIPASGAVTWFNRVYPNCYVLSAVTAPSYRAKTTTTLSVLVNPSSYLLGGLAISSSNLGISDGQLSHYIIRSDYPLALSAFVKNGVATGFSTEYLPKASDVDSSASGNMMFDAGVVTDPSAFSTSNGAITGLDAGDGGEIVNMLYETEYVPTS